MYRNNDPAIAAWLRTSGNVAPQPQPARPVAAALSQEEIENNANEALELRLAARANQTQLGLAMNNRASNRTGR